MKRADIQPYLDSIRDAHRLNTIERIYPEFLRDFSADPELAVKNLVDLGHSTGVIQQPINYVSWARCLARWAWKHGLLPYRPEIQLPRRTPVYLDQAPLTDAQIRILMAHIAGRGLIERGMVACMLVRGLRRNEVLSIRHGDVGPDYVAIKPKGHRVYVKIPCGESIISILRALRDAASAAHPNCLPESYLFCAPRALDGYGDYDVIPAMSEAGFKLIVDQWGEAIGRDLTPHKFRHACATILIEAGQTARQVSNYLRQSLDETQKLYFDRKGQMAESTFDAIPSWMVPSSESRGEVAV